MKTTSSSAPVVSPSGGDPGHLSLEDPSNFPRRPDLLERAHAQALENVFDAVVVTDLDGIIVGWNRGSERLYGWPREEVLGESVDILHIPEERERLLARVLEGVEREGRWQGEVGLLRKDGTRGTIESSVVLVLDDDGQPVGALGINRDITARVEAQRRLREAEARFRTLVEHSLVGIYMIRDGALVYVNPRFEEISGYAEEELLGGFDLMDLVAAEDRAMVRENIRRRAEGERLDAPYTFRAVRKNGAVMDVEVRGARIEVEGAPTIIGMILDITERLEAERRLRESEERYRLIVDEMFGRVADVLASRTRLRERLLPSEADAGAWADAGTDSGSPQGNGAPPSPADVARDQADDEDRRYLGDVRAAILRNLADETYSVERLARDVAQSRSQLHRRLQELVNESPSSLLRRIRLEQAAHLLKRGEGSVAEVAYAVGFKSVSHFSQSFLGHFGTRPAAYRRAAAGGS